MTFSCEDRLTILQYGVTFGNCTVNFRSHFEHLFFILEFRDNVLAIGKYN